ncbi:MAG: hypothetical protein ACJARD_000074 [Alphaproteobacteria bacterium]|jgi:hypothetical protein
MKQSDLDILLKLDNIEANNIRRNLQVAMNKKQGLIERSEAMNKSFLKAKPTLQDAPYLKYGAIENQKINQQIQQLETQIEHLQNNMRDIMIQTTTYDTLKDALVMQHKKQLDRHQESQMEEFNIFKFNKINKN